jgi:hypothetical protein
MFSRLVLVAGVAFASFACKRSTDAGLAQSSGKPAANKPLASASAADRRPSPPHCEKSAISSYTIGEPGPRAANDPDEAPVGEPFAIEVGSAVAHAGGFAVGTLELVGEKSHAKIALVSPKGAGALVDLGRVHGDVEPPRLAAQGGRLVGVVADSDASGSTLRSVIVRQANGKNDVVWGVEVSEGRDESEVFDVELGARRALVTWDEYDKREALGLVRALSFDSQDPSNATPPRTLSGQSEDAEGPRLARRDGGFWIAWVSRERVQKPPAAARPRRRDAGSETDSVVEDGRRALRVARLDENGSFVAEPLIASNPDSHVLVFDLASRSNGELLLAWRDDETVVGAEAGGVKLARVAPDGSVERAAVQDDDVGAGAPVLLVDASAKQGAAWLALAGISEATRLGSFGSGLVLGDMAPLPPIGSAEPLALDGERLLVARPRGLAMELETLRCAAP